MSTETDDTPATEAMWISPSRVEYRRHNGRWSVYSRKFPGHWNGSQTLPPLESEILDALHSFRMTLESIAAQSSGVPGSTSRADCMAALAAMALRSETP